MFPSFSRLHASTIALAQHKSRRMQPVDKRDRSAGTVSGGREVAL